YRSPAGLLFTRRISVDDQALFTISDTVANYGAGPVTIAANGHVRREGVLDRATPEGVPSDVARNSIVHEGAIGVLGGTLRLSPYRTWRKKGPQPTTRPAAG